MQEKLCTRKIYAFPQSFVPNDLLLNSNKNGFCKANGSTSRDYTDSWLNAQWRFQNEKSGGATTGPRKMKGGQHNCLFGMMIFHSFED